MTLIKDGHWQDTYWADSYWQQNYWPEHGTRILPPPQSVTDFYRVRHKKEDLILTLWDDPEFLKLLTQFIEAI